MDLKIIKYNIFIIINNMLYLLINIILIMFDMILETGRIHLYKYNMILAFK